ncbi:MAG: DUF2269 family protein [Rhodococcus sp. (in: high G+C Gram-positive bacteria)]
MNKFFLILHVIAAILLIGPVTVSASLFPRYARAAARDPDGGATSVAALLERITRKYGAVSILVPVLGLVTAWGMGVLTDSWVVASIVLTLIAGGLLALVVVPGQSEVMAGLTGAPEPITTERPTSVSALAMTSGIFSLLWVVVVTLMILRPGSTTGG